MTAALWYARHGSVGVRLHEKLDDALHDVINMYETGTAWPYGIQLDDGSLLEGEELTARTDAVLREYSEKVRSGAPTKYRRVRCPFEENDSVEVPADYPDWVGVQK